MALPTDEELAKVVEQKMELLVNIAPSACLMDMQAVYGGDRGTTEERRLLYHWRCEKPVEFIKEMNTLERDFKRAIAALARADREDKRGGDLKSFKSEESPAVDEDGGIEQVEEWLRQWKEEHRGP